MKKLITSLLLVCAFILHSSYRDKTGGDLFQIYWNGQQVHQQFVHANKEIKSLQLPTFGDKDQLSVVYSHCGKNGKDRTLIFRNDKRELIRTLQYADNDNAASRMVVSGDILSKVKTGKMYLYYRSKELGSEKLLAIITSSNDVLHAKR